MSSGERHRLLGKAFGAEKTTQVPAPGGMIGHAEIRIEGAPVYLADESPQAGMQSPSSLAARR